MPAAHVPLDIYQGEDWTAQIVWTDDFDNPQNIVAPCRMDIKNSAGTTQISLMTPETELPEGEIPAIGLSSDLGLIQLHIEDTATAALVPGLYHYDLFVTVDDGGAYADTQRHPIIYGPVTVHKRTTVM